jgi:hypothetical protein
MSILTKLGFKKPITIGDIQVEDEMTVVSLVGDDLGEIGKPEAMKFKKTVGYGKMVFENSDKLPSIVPSNYMVRGTGGQDHAMSKVGIVRAVSSKEFLDACCIEQRQGGMLSGSGNEEDVLPVSLRKQMLTKAMRDKKEFGKMWNNIQAWIRGVPGISQSAAHLRYFYDNPEIKKALEEFAAAFEPVPGQIGAIIFFNNVPIGIEIMPSASHWLQYWKQLIRGSYGAELVKLKRQGAIPSSTLVLPDLNKDLSVSDAKAQLQKFLNDLKRGVPSLIKDVDINKSILQDSESGLTSNLVTTNTGGGGDVVYQGDEPIYLSIVL